MSSSVYPSLQEERDDAEFCEHEWQATDGVRTSILNLEFYCGETEDFDQENCDPEAISTAADRPKRTRQYVATLSEIQNCVKWMKSEFEQAGRSGLMAKAVKQFPQTFNTNPKADLQRASRYWNNRDEILSSDQVKSITRVQGGLQKRRSAKSGPGRGRKSEDWVVWLHTELTSEFERLLNTGVEFSSSTVILLAKNILERSDTQFKSDHVPPGHSEKPIGQRVTHRWVQTWRERHDIILKCPSGKPAVSQQKQTYTDQCVAFHLGQVRSKFMAGELDERLVRNMDETHVVIDQTMPRIYGFRGKSVKLMDVVSGTEALTLALRVTGGPEARLHDPFVIFVNKQSSYPIRGLPDVIDGKSKCFYHILILCLRSELSIVPQRMDDTFSRRAIHG